MKRKASGRGRRRPYEVFAIAGFVAVLLAVGAAGADVTDSVVMQKGRTNR